LRRLRRLRWRSFNPLCIETADNRDKQDNCAFPFNPLCIETKGISTINFTKRL